LAFDDINKRTESLQEYVVEDTISAGPYTTYLFIEKTVDGHERVLRLLRFKDVSIEAFQQDIEKTDITPMNREKILAGLRTTRARIIYLSRIGIQMELKRERIGSLIAKFFDFLMQREKTDTLVYCKLLKRLDTFIPSPYNTIGFGSDKKWGEYCVKYRFFYHLE
jgi:hypothetical protein